MGTKWFPPDNEKSLITFRMGPEYRVMLERLAGEIGVGFAEWLRRRIDLLEGKSRAGGDHGDVPVRERSWQFRIGLGAIHRERLKKLCARDGLKECEWIRREIRNATVEVAVIGIHENAMADP